MGYADKLINILYIETSKIVSFHRLFIKLDNHRHFPSSPLGGFKFRRVVTKIYQKYKLLFSVSCSSLFRIGTGNTYLLLYELVPNFIGTYKKFYDQPTTLMSSYEHAL